VPILALDTSSAVAVAVLDDSGAVLSRGADSGQRRHAEQLAPMIVAALAEAGVDRRELTAVVAGTGPAPFTGLRVGLVTARTLALALDVPVWGVSSLDALAAPALRAARERGDDDARVLVVTDARRREVYWALYRADAVHGGPLDVGPLLGPGVAHPAQLAADGVTEGAALVGRGAVLYAAELGRVALLTPGAAPTDAAPTDAAPHDVAPAEAPADPDPAELGRIALARAAAGVEQPTEPLYLRRPDAVPTAGGKRVLA